VNRSAVTQRRPQARLSQDDFEGEPILQARALSLWYGKQQALDSVTLDIAKNKSLQGAARARSSAASIA
jgi:hypothetical protein